MAEPTPQVLVVDDERFFREAIGDALAAAGIVCDKARSGEEALDAVGKGGIGVVVLDIQLPGMTGIEVLRQLHTRDPSLRVIILSAHTNQEDVLEALRLHACDYLAKPLHDEELVLAVRRAMASYATEASLRSLRRRLSALEARSSQLSNLARAEAPALDGGIADVAERIGESAVQAVAEVVGAAKTSLMLLDPDRDELVVAAASGRKLLPGEMDAVRVGEGIAGFAFSRGQVLLVDDLGGDERFPDRAPSDRYASRALAIAPVESPGNKSVLGVICATDRPGGAAFGEEEVTLLRILAREIGRLMVPREEATQEAEPPPVSPDESDLTIQMTLAPEPSRAAQDAELAREICEAIGAEVEPNRLLRTALRAVAKSLPAAPVALYLVDNISGDLRLEAQWEADGPSDRPVLSRTRGLTGNVLQTGRLVAADEPAGDPRFDAEVDTPGGGAAAPLLCVPVRLRGKTLGVVRAFPADGASSRAGTGEVLSGAISAAVRNVLLYRSLLESIEDLAKARRESPG